MAFVILGVVLITLHFAGIGPPATWNWAFGGDLWKFVLPFVLALAWWAFSDMTGRTRRMAMQKEQAKAQSRRHKQIDSLKPPGMR